MNSPQSKGADATKTPKWLLEVRANEKDFRRNGKYNPKQKARDKPLLMFRISNTIYPGVLSAVISIAVPSTFK